MSYVNVNMHTVKWCTCVCSSVCLFLCLTEHNSHTGQSRAALQAPLQRRHTKIIQVKIIQGGLYETHTRTVCQIYSHLLWQLLETWMSERTSSLTNNWLHSLTGGVKGQGVSVHAWGDARSRVSERGRAGWCGGQTGGDAGGQAQRAAHRQKH